ncbi:MAG: glutamate--cysteine ligase [Gaiellaceae bacterium]
MDVNYGSSAPFSLGVEEEFQLLNAESFELTSRFDQILAASGGDPQIKPELMQSTVEAATGIATTVAEAIEQARELRRRVRDAAAEHGVVFASAGTHPFSRYEHQDVTEQARYRELLESMQWVAERELIFGLHVHVGLESAQQAIAVANALRTWLPELLALSANSPFWLGRDTGLASTRSKVFDSFPRSGLPPAFSSFEEFELLVERGVKTGSFDDYTYIWWDLRPHPKLGTIEIRVCDGQTRIETVSALVALVQSLVVTLAGRYDAGGSLPIQPVTLVAENKWRAARYGLEADLVDLESDTERPARDAARALVDLAEPAARRLGCAAELGELDSVLERGTGADEQRRVYQESGTLLAVAQWLAAQSVAGI